MSSNDYLLQRDLVDIALSPMEVGMLVEFLSFSTQAFNTLSREYLKQGLIDEAIEQDGRAKISKTMMDKFMSIGKLMDKRLAPPIMN
jgi:hypothetical protein